MQNRYKYRYKYKHKCIQKYGYKYRYKCKGMGPIDATTKHVQTWIPLDLNQYGGASIDWLKVSPTYFSCVRSSIMTIVDIMAHFAAFAQKK